MPRTASRTGIASPAGRSEAATAADTPSARRALVRSTRRTCPCAMGERTTRAPARAGGGQHGLDDALVAGAAAQVGGDELAHLRLGGGVGCAGTVCAGG